MSICMLVVCGKVMLAYSLGIIAKEDIDMTTLGAPVHRFLQVLAEYVCNVCGSLRLSSKYDMNEMGNLMSNLHALRSCWAR